MTRERIDTWLERVVLALVFAVLGFGTLALGGVRPSEFVVIEWLVLAILVIWIARIWVAPKFRLLLPPAAWAVLPFVAYAVWRYRAADIEHVARQEFIEALLCISVF